MIRLLDPQTFVLHEIADTQVNEYKYMILSHTWSTNGEVTLDDINCRRFLNQDAKYAKLKNFCALAIREDYRWVWIDTCYIDKNSTTDVQQAINSMYKWYAAAHICVAYLEDVGPGRKGISESKWFTRGWTLQELLAPEDVLFYDHDWQIIGDRSEHVTLLSAITGVPENVLNGSKAPQLCSVAQRMSWAAGRTTTRLEDRAYSLIGLFDVTCDTIYGIGEEKAFRSLKNKIIEEFSDQSIFAWTMPESSNYSGMLASSPSAFEHCSHIVDGAGLKGFHRDNLGLSIELQTRPFSMNTYVALLDAVNTQTREPYAIFLMKLSPHDQYVRVKNIGNLSRVLTNSHSGDIRRPIRVRDNPPPVVEQRAYGFWLRTLEVPGRTDLQTSIRSCGTSPSPDRILIPEGSRATAGIVINSLRPGVSQPGWSKIRSLKFGFDDDFHPVCRIANSISFDEAQNPRDSFFSKDWMRKDGGEPTLTRRWPDGFLVVRGDKETGLERDIAGLNIHLSMQLCPNLYPASQVEAEQIWTVDITTLQENLVPERAHNIHQCKHILGFMGSIACLAIGCDCPLRGYVNLTRQGHLPCCEPLVGCCCGM